MQRLLAGRPTPGKLAQGKPACRRLVEKLTSVPEDRIQPSAINSAPILPPSITIKGPQ